MTVTVPPGHAPGGSRTGQTGNTTKEIDMFTISVTRYAFGRVTGTGYYGSFDTADAACDVAVRIESDGLLDGTSVLDVVPLPDGVTPGHIAADYLT